MLSRLGSLVRSLVDPASARIDADYRERDYLTAYALHTDRRVERDPRAAIGGRWLEMGLLQFGFLVANGLRPSSTLLDYGCGTLRGGRHFIRYLDVGNYVGVDLSTRALDYARRLVEKEGLAEKRPRLIHNDAPTAPFSCVAGHTFDFILAQSVVTHLPMDVAEAILADVGHIMKETSTFFFTYNDRETYARKGRKGYVYPMAFFERQASLRDCTVTDRSGDYPHPDGQRMLAWSLGRRDRPRAETA
jgi:SAM-dependent methyltransferase